ncbi:phage tail protein, partial [Xenorhabdus griffiniae]|nr:phage tail protein [Xenorhabdus griffiniae]
VYLIKNVLGFNADAAWGGVDGGVDIPLCKNKLPLIWVNYKVLPDGSIKLMTYHREHADAPAFARNVREGYADGDPIDIPSGRFISVRVQMPENSIWNQQQRKLAESK